MIHLSDRRSDLYQHIRFCAPNSSARGRPRWEEFKYWLSYFHQVNEILRIAAPGDRILEVGPGNYFTTDVLRRLGFQVVTVDMDPAAGADMTADLRDLSLEEESFDVICCFQVLEHIPFADFGKILARLGAASRRYCLLSLPEPGIELGVMLRIPPGWLPRRFRRLGDGIPLFMKVSRSRPMDPRPWPQHQWAVGRRNFSRATVEGEIERAGFRIVRKFNAPQAMYFLFYVLERRDPKGRRALLEFAHD
jgi:methyltransferase family protein